MAYEEVAQLDTEHPEPEEEYRDELPGDYRIVSRFDGEGACIEKDWGNDDTGWHRLAEITEPNAPHEVVEELNEAFDTASVRAIFDWTNDGFLIEYWEESED